MKDIEVIKKELKELFPDADEVGVKEDSPGVGQAWVGQMYEYVEIDFATMMKLREVFGGEFNIDQKHFSGCETCDWGSSYEKTFYFQRGA